MRFIIAILWAQVVLGAVGVWGSFGYAHSAAVGNEWWMYFEKDFKKLQGLPEYREPLAIHGLTYARVIEAHRSSAQTQLRMAGYGLAFSCTVAVAAMVLLWRIHGLSRTFRLQHQRTEPNGAPGAQLDHS